MSGADIEVTMPDGSKEPYHKVFPLLSDESMRQVNERLLAKFAAEKEARDAEAD